MEVLRSRANLGIQLVREAIGLFRLRATGPLILGTVASQAISVVSLPILSRLYSPESFGVFALVQSFAAFFTLATTLNLAGVTPTIPAGSFATRFTSIMLAAAGALAVLAAFAILSTPISLLRASGLGGRSLAGMAVFAGLTGTVFVVLRAYLIKLNVTTAVGSGQIGRAIVTLILAVVLAWSPLNGDWSLSLVLASVIGDVAAIGWFLVALPARNRRLLAPFRPRRMVAELRRNRRVIFSAAWANVVATAIGQLPIWVIITAFGPEQAGWFALSVRIVSVPSSFIGSTVTGVLSSQLSADYHRGKAVGRAFRLSVIVLAIVGLTGFGLLAVMALSGMAAIFGERWSGAATTLSILSIMGFTTFLSSATNFAPLMLRASRFLIVWSTGRAALMAVTLLGAMALSWTYNHTILAYSSAEAMAYLTFMWFVLSRTSRTGAAIPGEANGKGK